MAQKRIFITTGILSLLNTLTVIKQINKEYEDYLLIVSFYITEEFKDANLKLAKLHNFKEIIIIEEKELDKKIEQLNLDSFEELYTVTNFNFNHKNKNILDEGISIINRDLETNDIKYCFIHDYLNIFDFSKNPKIKYIEKSTFLKICDYAANIYPLAPPILKGKNVLIPSQYIIYDILQDETLDLYKKIIRKFIDYGFNVYFKFHPRENVIFKENLTKSFREHFFIFNTALPIEIYNIDFTLIISFFSGTNITIPYFREIPSLSIVPDKVYTSNILPIDWKFLALIIEQNTLTYKEVEDILKKDISPGSCREILFNIQMQKINCNKKITYHKSIKFQHKYKRTLKKFNLLNKVLSCLIPIKKIRKKIRNQSDNNVLIKLINKEKQSFFKRKEK